MLDERMRPVANPELPEIARMLPADTICQIIRTAERLGFTDYSDVLAEVANAVTRNTARPRVAPHAPAPQLAGTSFPHPPPTMPVRTGLAAVRPGRAGSRPKLAR